MINNINKRFLFIVAMILITSSAFPQILHNPKISQSVFFTKSKPVREMKIILPGIHEKEQHIVKNRMPRGVDKINTPLPPADKPEIQRTQGPLQSIGPTLNFAGIDNVNGRIPADPNGDVSPLYYMQTVNRSFAVWDKEGNLLYGPVDNASIWEGFEGPWNNTSWGGDPVFKYDQLADRWVVSAFSVNLDEELYYEMVAVSITSDPLGAYYCYAFQFDYFNDYPKLSIWPDGYYITYNMYDGIEPDAFLYSLVTVIDREAMLAGEPEITMIQFEIPEPDVERFFPMAADFRGNNFTGDEPCFIISIDDHNPSILWELSLDIYEFQTDWQIPENSQFGIVAQFDLGSFEPYVTYGPGAPQNGSDINITTVPLYVMYPVTCRKFATYECLLCCHTIWDGEIHYIKWYELRNEEAGWYMYQSGNYAPGDSHYYFPSITVNGNGDIALGYTISNEEIYPSIRITGRRAEDPLGTMSFQEIELYQGLNYANNYFEMYDQNRWGDYASMMVDPVDDTTFWFTSMYTIHTTDRGNWATRIASFNLSDESTSPYVEAGNDTLTCNTPFFITQGHAENYSSIIWTTSGDGTFLDNYAINATYLRGPDDITNGQVGLTLHITGYEPGTVAADSMILYINKEPEVYAGPDDTIDTSESVTLLGEVNFAYEYFWITLGDGSFADSTMLDAIYTPGPEDIINQGVTLVLTAYEVSPCTGSVSDSLNVYIIATGMDDLLTNKFDIQIFPNPTSDIITLKAYTNSEEQLVVEILDGIGKAIFTGRFYSFDTCFEKQFDLSYLKPGIYFVRLQAGSWTTTGKVVLLR